jgi:DNA polymerase-3 subunit epsilon
MRRDKRLLAMVATSVAGAIVLVALWLAATVALIAAALDPGQRHAVAAMVTPYLPDFVVTTLILAGVIAAVAQALYQRWIAPTARLLEQARVLAGTDVARELKTNGSPELRDLAQVITELARQRGALKEDIERQVAAASRDIGRERNRLAALMGELTQAVVVCNLDGRILLYNNRARLQFRAFSSTPKLADGAELIGLGRSIYTVFNRKLVEHALENVQQRLDRGAADPSAQFVTTTRAGQLLRVQMAPVRGATADDPGDPDEKEGMVLSGFVLMLENITRNFEQESKRDRLLHGLTEGSRGSLANLQAAAERLGDPSLDEASRERALGIVREEADAMGRRIEALGNHFARGLAARWPLEEMLGADLIAAAQRRIEARLGSPVRADDVDAALWLYLDSFTLLQGLVYLADRLRNEHDVKDVRLRLSRADSDHAHLDLLWVGRAMSTETVVSWEIDPLRIGDESSPLTLREIVERHGGEFWFERDRVRHQAFFRFLLPLASERAELEAAAFVRSDSRPEYYDFDLFQVSETTRELDDRRLVELTYTVFDTETTGLEPSNGDEIIQIGAVRLVNGKLRRSESFEQLVDPRRDIPPQSIPIHGIQPSMVAGQPTIDAVLPAFHAYVHDTVLVAHNAAFDMRFLQTKEQALGLHFDQPVLDTLLLSAVVHPNQESHKLEAIAERFDISVIGRHTALGDAIVTAEVFLKLIPLLAEKGIETLGQARAASRKTYFARLKY